MPNGPMKNRVRKGSESDMHFKQRDCMCVCGLVIGCKLFDMIVFCCWDRCWLFFELFLCFSSFSFDGCAYGCAFVYTSYL